MNRNIARISLTLGGAILLLFALNAAAAYVSPEGDFEVGFAEAPDVTTSAPGVTVYSKFIAGTLVRVTRFQGGGGVLDGDELIARFVDEARSRGETFTSWREADSPEGFQVYFLQTSDSYMRVYYSRALFYRVSASRKSEIAAATFVHSFRLRAGRPASASSNVASARPAAPPPVNSKTEAARRFYAAIEFIKQGKLEEAIARFESGLLLDPDSTPGHFWLGITYGTLRNSREANRHLRRVIELDPGSSEAARARTALGG